MKKHWLLPLTLSATLFLSACATSSSDDEVAQAKTNFAQQNYQLAFKQIQAPAQQGDPESQYALGYMYYYGKGTPMNHTLGKEWIKKAADNGDSNAQQAYQMIVTQEQTNITNPPVNAAASAHSAATPVALAPVATPVAAPAAAVVTHSNAAVASGNLTVDERAILKAPAHEYTLQLANAPSAAAAKSYIQRHQLGKAAKYYSREVNGQKTYTVIYGHYTSRNTALAALHKLPATIQKAKPWPRPLSSVQGEIRSNS
jgi:TPR repeat protein